ncbi:heme NO-binding domain-containing protein [Sediminicola luteus]|uniref:Heme NO-binding domain-containing protein n=1 Tax=Sediminicola luteus TaxID=319238 RepID=A0A2A4G2A3_9FLAO|nr:heme NO-binding domain-containing protein [Sediminicola luteus]PCE62561.1 hypothetical protein B7P33_18160 [Sediminicola luteus]
MKGVVFVEFLEMMDRYYGEEVTEKIIEDSQLESEGHYTAVGTYPDAEMVSLLTQLHGHSGTPVPELLREFGLFLFESFSKRYAHLMAHLNDSFDMLRRIDDYIHVEVRKIYDKTKLPTFSYEDVNDTTLKLIYTSERKLPDLAQGLIEGTMHHFNQAFSLTRENVAADGSHVIFTIEKN